MLSTAAPGSQDTANNYGQYLLRNAMQLINDVVTSKVDLPGIPETGANASTIQGATIINQDRYSQVDLYYDNFESEGLIPGLEPREPGTQWPLEVDGQWH